MTGKLILILAFSLFAFCQGEPICTSTNQCRDFWIAKKCDAVDQCLAEDWSRLQPTGERDDMCTICLRMVKEARDTLQSNETRKELREVLEGSCALLGLKPAVKLCDKLVDEYSEELVKILASEMDPESVCTVAKLCNNNALRLIQKDSKDCVHCKAFMQVADEQMDSLSFEKFKNEILQACRSAGGFSDACSHLGLVNARFLYDVAKSALKRKPCEAMVVCPTNTGNQDSISLGKTKRVMCPMCKTVMRSVRDQLLKVKSAEEYGENVMEVCGKLNIDGKICREISSKDFYEKLKSFEKLPDLFCHVVYCMERGEDDVPMWPLVPAHLEASNSTDMKLFDLMAFADLMAAAGGEAETTTVRPRPTIAYGDSIENPVFLGPFMPPRRIEELPVKKLKGCELCLNVMNVFKQGDSVIWGPKLEEKCTSLTGISKNMCRDLSSTFVGLVSLLKNSTERDACNFVKVCEPSSEVAAALTSGSYCSTCMLTIQSLKDAMKNDISDEAVETILDSLCDLLPHSEKHLCYNLVKNVGVEGFKRLIMNISPAGFCKELHICGNNDIPTTTTEIAVKEEKGEKASCKFCMMAIKMLLDQLGNTKTEESIRKALDSLCNYFPEETRKICRNMIDEYADMIIDMIIADFNATEVCYYLKLCPVHLFLQDERNAVVYNVETNEIRDWDEYNVGLTNDRRNEEIANAFDQFHSAVQDCALCEALVGVISNHKTMLDKDYDFDAHSQAICSFVPKRKLKRCKSMVVSYGPSIVNLILDHNVKPDEICVYIDLCSRGMQAKVNQPVSVPEPKVVVPKKENDCLKGPVYWCANAENAEKCGTYLHCKETVWKTWQSPPSRPSSRNL